ncbi:hypothetical protein SCAR479_07949 [Seiridium cardinale]|uniref:Uncharacterized protein n=1 Tax=Seiridium cardinale TaxID=138064 RepID=A0ABR2XN88_9PEZI
MLDLKIFAALATRAHHASSGIAKRGEPGSDQTSGAVAYIVIALNVALFLPVFVYLTYTLSGIFPILAIVESKPGYERIPSKGDDDLKGDKKVQSDSIEEPDTDDSKPITSSIHTIHNLLRSISGFRSLFRSFPWLFVLAVVNIILAMTLYWIPFLPRRFDGLLAEIITLQLQVTWVHLVVTAPSDKWAWKRIPGFKQTIRAVALPVVITSITVFLAELLPALAMMAMKVVMMRPYNAFDYPEQNTPLWKFLIFLFMRLAVTALLNIPAQAIMVRCAVSILPEDGETIVPVDRTFGIESAREKGYLSVIDAFRSMKGAWGRLYKLWFKVFLLTVAIEILVGAVMFLELLGLALYSSRHQSHD